MQVRFCFFLECGALARYFFLYCLFYYGNFKIYLRELCFYRLQWDNEPVEIISGKNFIVRVLQPYFIKGFCDF